MSKIVRKNGNGRYSEAVNHNGIIYISGQVCDPGPSLPSAVHAP